MQRVMDDFNSSISATASLNHKEDYVTDIEVYLLFKALYNKSYFPDPHMCHHVLVFKLRQEDNVFYYTDLDSSNFGKGRIKIVFGPYYFYPSKTIYYQPLGISRKRTLTEIRQFAEGNRLNGQIFCMFKQNCQHYVSSCIEFLGLDKNELKSGDVYWTKEANDMKLQPPSTTRVLPLKTITCLTLTVLLLIVVYLQ